MKNRKERYGNLVRGWDWRTSPVLLSRAEKRREELNMNKTEYLEYLIEKDTDNMSETRFIHTVRFDTEEISSLDLVEEIESSEDPKSQFGTAEIIGEDGYVRTGENTMEFAYFPLTGRIGISCGADSGWADADSIEHGIWIYLNNPQEFVRRN